MSNQFFGHDIGSFTLQALLKALVSRWQAQLLNVLANE
jgi:hypothetical protein